MDRGIQEAEELQEMATKIREEKRMNPITSEEHERRLREQLEKQMAQDKERTLKQKEESYARPMTPAEYQAMLDVMRLRKAKEKEEEERMHQEKQYLGGPVNPTVTNLEMRPTITHKAGSIHEDMTEITAMMNELSFRLYGQAQPKIEQRAATEEIISIDGILDEIKYKTNDIRKMLAEFMLTV